MHNAGLTGKYLGVPTIIGRTKKEVFAYIKDKVWRRLCGWNRKFLSQAGKEILLKSVAQATLSFVMSVFLLPSSLSMELESMMNSFGGAGIRKRGKGLVQLLCISKNERGLAFRKLHLHNVFLVAKHAWRMLVNPKSLVGRIFEAKYFPNSRVTSVLKRRFSGTP